MAKNTKRFRRTNWSHEDTLVLAKMKRDALLREEDGAVMWERIAQKIPSTTAKQCTGRWDNLVKVYNQIEAHCEETGPGRDHLDLREDELATMKLATGYRQDWYTIVKQVQEFDQVVGQMSRGSTTSSHSDLLSERTALRDSLHLTPPTSFPASTSESVTQLLDAEPSFEVSLPSPEEEIHQDQSPCNSTEWAISMIQTPPEVEQVEGGCELTEPRDSLRDCPSYYPPCGAVNVAGAMGPDLDENFSCFEILPWEANDSDFMATFLSRNLAQMSLSSTVRTSPSSTVSEGMISGQDSRRNKPTRGLDTNLDVQSASEEESEQSQRRALKVIEIGVALCCDKCIRRIRGKLEEMPGVEKPVIFDQPNKKVSVTTTAQPEDVLKQVRMVKFAVMWSEMK